MCCFFQSNQGILFIRLHGVRVAAADLENLNNLLEIIKLLVPLCINNAHYG